MLIDHSYIFFVVSLQISCLYLIHFCLQSWIILVFLYSVYKYFVCVRERYIEREGDIYIEREGGRGSISSNSVALCLFSK